MKLVVITIFAAMLFLGTIIGLSTVVSCNSVMTRPAWAYTDCDTVRFTAANRDYIKILCTVTDTLVVTDTLYVDVYIEPDWDCIKAVLDLKGLGHWEEAIEGCLDD